jgi:GntR family transcriptional repressor for pyruvate dehydrogenase complex
MKRRLSHAKPVEYRIRPVSKASISDKIVEQIIALIERGDLKPGQRLPPERELCLRFGIGRSSLREALRCLAIVGVLNVRVGEGTSIAEDGGKFLVKILQWRLITEQHDLENLMEVRIALEGVAAASVARNGSEEEIDELQAMTEKMSACLNDRKRFSKLDLEFHLALSKASGSPLLLDMISTIREQVAVGLARVLTPANALPRVLEEHRRIVQKIRKHDSKGAREAIRTHLENSIERYRQSLTSEAPANPVKKRIPKDLSLTNGSTNNFSRSVR